MKKIVFAFFLFCLAFASFSQDAGTPRVATGLRADGKIYVVLAVALTILIGLLAYLIRLDKKISRLEKEK